MVPFPLAGYAFALSAAFLWAVVAILYKNISTKISPWGISIGKSFFAIIYLALSQYFVITRPIDEKSFFLLILSGIFGITLGDTLFFASICTIHASLAVLLSTLIPTFTIFLAFFFLDEILTFQCLIGVFFTLSGIACATILSFKKTHLPGCSIKGVVLGTLSSFFCAISIILSKKALLYTSALHASLIRHTSALITLLFLGLISFKIKKWILPIVQEKEIIKKLSSIAFLGTFLGTWFYLIGLKLSSVSMVTVLSSTSPLFVIPLSSAFLKEKISFGYIITSCITILGVYLIITGGIKS